MSEEFETDSLYSSETERKREDIKYISVAKYGIEKLPKGAKLIIKKLPEGGGNVFDWMEDKVVSLMLVDNGGKLLTVKFENMHKDKVGLHAAGMADGNLYRHFRPTELFIRTEEYSELAGKESKSKEEEIISISNTLMKSLSDKIAIEPDDLTAVVSTILQQTDSAGNKLLIDWGIEETIEKGLGTVLMFYGPPGTGKTMLAELICKQLNIQYELIGSGELESSIPGEYERRVKELFENAASENAALIFDECDSLMFSRTQVGAILASQINSLLSSIERFKGLCILTTNRSHTLDSALERRISLKLKFEKPDKELRKKIWNILLPKKMPLDGFNLEEISEFELTGGQIKNSILTAARLAVFEKKDKVGHMHFIKGIQREVEGSKAFIPKFEKQTAATDLAGVDNVKKEIEKKLKEIDMQAKSKKEQKDGTAR